MHPSTLHTSNANNEPFTFCDVFLGHLPITHLSIRFYIIVLFIGKVFALRAHCVCTACALRAHCVHIAVKPTPCHLCMTLQSNKANRTHIEPLPTRHFDVPVNISCSVVEYHYAVATTVTLVSAIVITYFIHQRIVRAFAKDHVDPKS